MDHGHNGNAPPTFHAPGVPIIGQLVTPKICVVTVLAVCNCAHPEPILIVGVLGAALGQCPSCKRAWRVTTLRHDPASGATAIDLQPFQLPGQPEPAGSEAGG